jgi:hypothetical protein
MPIRALLKALAVTLAACAPPAQNAIEATPSPAAEGVSVEAPAANARVSSPLTVTGTAPADWFFENQFPVRLLDAQDNEIAHAPAQPRINWTEPGPKSFDAELTFEVEVETSAMLVLEEDMPGEGVEPRQLRVPVTLLPPPQ